MNDILIKQLAPTGVLRAGINMSNFLLVSSKTEAGEPAGVSPDMAKAIADKLGVGLKLIPYNGPGDVADGAAAHEWDIANIAAEPERAKTITFSPAYCEIQATYLLPANSPIKHIEDVDKAGIRIAVKKRAAYELWLTDNLVNATLVRTETMDDSVTEFTSQSLDVLAGLRPRLLEDVKKISGATLMDESFTAVQQSIGCMPNNTDAAIFIRQFVSDAISSGLVARLIEQHGVHGKLSVAPGFSA